MKTKAEKAIIMNKINLELHKMMELFLDDKEPEALQTCQMCGGTGFINARYEQALREGVK